MNGPIYWRPQRGRKRPQASYQTSAFVAIFSPSVGTTAAAPPSTGGAAAIVLFFEVKKNTKDKIIHLYILDTTSPGEGLTGLAYMSSGLTAYYFRRGESTSHVIALVDIATLGQYVSGGFKEMDSTNMSGWYEFHVPAICLGENSDHCSIHFQGYAGMVPLPIEIELVDNIEKDTFDAVAGFRTLLEQLGLDQVNEELRRLKNYIQSNTERR